MSNVQRHREANMKCQYDGCEAEGKECYLPDDPRGDEARAPDGHYCDEHAASHGFCPGCGEFWGGVSQFEADRLCWHCKDELEEEIDDRIEYLY